MLCKSPKGLIYFTEPEVEILAKTQNFPENMRQFLKELGFEDYLNDLPHNLTKISGQLDYMSFGKNRTWNKDTDKYIKRTLESKHGNLLEMTNVVFLCWGISRACTHEIVRHRQFAFSQTSTRYSEVIRFVEPFQYQQSDTLHNMFIAAIELVKSIYDEHVRHFEMCYNDFEGTERKKAVRQASRYVLPHFLEAPIIISGDLRAWRVFVELRANKYADIEIRRLAYKIAKKLHSFYPHETQDFVFDDDYVSVEYSKV